MYIEYFLNDEGKTKFIIRDYTDGSNPIPEGMYASEYFGSLDNPDGLTSNQLADMGREEEIIHADQDSKLTSALTGTKWGFQDIMTLIRTHGEYPDAKFD
jgi:hypothetical protein